MPKEEWGVKRLCPTTGKRFYDLNRTPVVSPYTGEIVQIEPLTRREAAAAAEASRNAKKTARVAEADLDEDDLIESDEDSDIDVDEDLLEDESDDDTVALDDLTDVPGGNDET